MCVRRLIGIDSMVRRKIGGLFPGRFPWLYSTLDAPSLVVPVQVAAYQLAAREYIESQDRVLDVGFGLGYGLKLMADKARELVGIDIDRKAVRHGQRLAQQLPRIRELRSYDGRHIPYVNHAFEVVTCIDVIEHVPDYEALIAEMVRVAKRMVLLSTPNRRPEYTRPDGRPWNHWHLREWSYEEFDCILQRVRGVRVEWSFLNGLWGGPFICGPILSADTMALTPALIVVPSLLSEKVEKGEFSTDARRVEGDR